MEHMDWLELITPATVLGAAVFIWRVVARAGDLAKAGQAESEKRITANADRAHAAIGERIDRLNGRTDRLNAKVDGGNAALGERIEGLARKADAMKDRLADTREDVAALKAYLLPPHPQRPQQ